MEQSVIFVLLLIVSYVQSANMDNNTFFPQLLFGEYHLHAKSVIPCDPMRKNKYQFNARLNKISPTRAEFEGNLTITDIPFDDSMTILGSWDQKDSYGGWATNSYVFKKDKGCSSFKSMVKDKNWKNLGCNNGCPCPIPPGVYTVNEFPASYMDNALNFPKVFFYGTYKFRITIWNKSNEQIGCITIVTEIKRLWEQP